MACHLDWLVQESRNSSALAMELRLSCTNPATCPLPSYYSKQQWFIIDRTFRNNDISIKRNIFFASKESFKQCLHEASHFVQASMCQCRPIIFKCCPILQLLMTSWVCVNTHDIHMIQLWIMPNSTFALLLMQVYLSVGQNVPDH